MPAPFTAVRTARLLGLAVPILCGCGADAPEAPPHAPPMLASWTFDSSMVFPADRSLSRPEDGVALPGGRVLVTDQVHGLRLVEPDGRSAPFGGMAAAGYRHDPPAHPGGANGISLEPGGTHVLVADIFGGGIYRVEVATGGTERIYQHRYGVNTAVRDSRGAVWFTQSAHNTPDDGEGRMWATIDIPVAEGALYRIANDNGALATTATLMVDSLQFANGIAIDEASGKLYLAETVGSRVLGFRADLAAGTLSERTVVVDSAPADNLKLDDVGRLWLGLPALNAVMAIDTKSGLRHVAFQSLSQEQAAAVAEFNARGTTGTSRMELLTPASWAPLPGFVTGVIMGTDGRPAYLSGLGNALIRLP